MPIYWYMWKRKETILRKWSIYSRHDLLPRRQHLHLCRSKEPEVLPLILKRYTSSEIRIPPTLPSQGNKEPLLKPPIQFCLTWSTVIVCLGLSESDTSGEQEVYVRFGQVNSLCHSGDKCVGQITEDCAGDIDQTATVHAHKLENWVRSPTFLEITTGSGPQNKNKNNHLGVAEIVLETSSWPWCSRAKFSPWHPIWTSKPTRSNTWTKSQE